jgi:glutamate racemase
MNEEKLREDILPSLLVGSDVVVLGCTHYHWVEDEIREIVGGKAIILQPEQVIISQLKRVIAQLA